MNKVLKKTFAIAALLAVVSVLVVGAIYRTQARAGTGDGSGARSGGSRGSDAAAGRQVDGYLGGRHGGREHGRGADGETHGGAADGTGSASRGLSATEAEMLLYMREEEKMARDVYAALHARWGLPIFQNIGQAEESHTAAVLALLEHYDLTDPTPQAAGQFAAPELQALYHELVERGNRSLADALRVGAEIEEIDILALQERLGQVSRADIRRLLDNLMEASRNHLRAFVSALRAQTGEVYQPLHLSREAYDVLVNADTGWTGHGKRWGQ